MRRLFALLLLALLLGLGVALLVETDPGYVLVAYRRYTLETSLWVGLLLWLLGTVWLLLLVYLLRRLVGGRGSVLHWMGSRKARQSIQLTNRGLISFIEGNWQKSRALLLRGARYSDAPLLNYLIAARASYRLGEREQMRAYLSAAEGVDAQATIAVELTQAEMQLDARQDEQALATLERARRNAARHPHVLELLSEVYRRLEDWDNLATLLPELARHKVLPEAGLQALERSVHLQRLRECAARAGGDAVAGLWRGLPAPWRRDAELLRTYVALLVSTGAHAAADQACLRALGQGWNSELARLYGLIRGDVEQQLAQAENWLVEHSDEASLLLSLGRLSARNRLWGKARDYLERSYRSHPGPEVCAELGRLLRAQGEFSLGARYFEQALGHSLRLPDLPLPDESGATHLPLLEKL
ncbi:MAG: heme biosynthesis protein HemY [Parahaliea sp.]